MNIETHHLIFLALSILAMFIGLERLYRWLEHCVRTSVVGYSPMRYEVRKQFRRFQLGLLLLLEGVLLLVGIFLRPESSPTAFVWVWFLAIVILLWLMLICFAEMVSASLYHRREREKILSEELRMVALHQGYLDGGELDLRQEE